MAQEAVAAHVALTIGLHLLDRIRRIRFLKYKLVRPNADMRVAFSALLRICEGGRYLLIRNLHRPQTFGPFGGVYKYYGGAKKELDEILFRPQDLGPGSDMKDDLRGFLPRKNLVRVDRWFAASHERESPGECLRRELTEELKETKPSIRLPVPGALPLSLVRVVHEGPLHVPGQQYLQYRVFEVFEGQASTTEASSFFKSLLKIAESHGDLLMAHAEEIITGRARDGRAIGPHAAYFIGRKNLRPDDPAFPPSYDKRPTV